MEASYPRVTEQNLGVEDQLQRVLGAWRSWLARALGGDGSHACWDESDSESPIR